MISFYFGVVIVRRYLHVVISKNGLVPILFTSSSRPRIGVLLVRVPRYTLACTTRPAITQAAPSRHGHAGPYAHHPYAEWSSSSQTGCAHCSTSEVGAPDMGEEHCSDVGAGWSVDLVLSVAPPAVIVSKIFPGIVLAMKSFQNTCWICFPSFSLCKIRPQRAWGITYYVAPSILDNAVTMNVSVSS